jgi:hypothetical protein
VHGRWLSFEEMFGRGNFVVIIMDGRQYLQIFGEYNITHHVINRYTHVTLL